MVRTQRLRTQNLRTQRLSARLLMTIAIAALAFSSACTDRASGPPLHTSPLVVLTPSADGVANESRPWIKWTADPAAETYDVRVYSDADRQNLVYATQTKDTQARLEVAQADGLSAYTSIIALDGSNNEVARAQSRFRIRILPTWMPNISLTQHVPALSEGGYRLFNLIDLQPQASTKRVAAIVLVNTLGEIIWWHRQTDADFMMDQRVLPNGNLFYIHRSVSSAFKVEARATEMTWAGEIIWQSDSKTLVHHDAGLGPLNAYMLLTWTFKTLGTISYEGDGIELVNPITDEVLWTWNIFDHFDPVTHWTPESTDIGRSFLGNDWSHANALTWDPARSLIWMSVRHFDSLIGIEYPSGRVAVVLGRLGIGGASLMNHQHAPEVEEDGSILLFDNGNTRNPPYSRVICFSYDETAQTTSTLFEWTDTPRFYDNAVGDANRLPGGNILVTAGVSGRIIEITGQGEIAWELEIDQTNRPRWVYRTELVPSGLIPTAVLPFAPAQGK